MGDRRPLEIRDERLEVLAALTRESNDDVGSDRGVRHPRPDVVDEGRVLLDRVGPPHRREYAIAGVLEREMKMRRKPIGRRDEVDDRARAVHRLERADAEENRALA